MEVTKVTTQVTGSQEMETIQKHFFSDLSVMLGRSMRHFFRSMDTIVTVTITPTLYQLGVCANQFDAAGSQGLCRKPASDGDRGNHSGVTGWTARVSGDLGCACLVRRHSGCSLHLCDEGI